MAIAKQFHGICPFQKKVSIVQKTLLFIVALMGITGLFLTDQWQVKIWQIKKTAELNAITELCKDRIQNSVSSRLNALESLTSLFILHPNTQPQAFAHFAALILKFNPPIRALQYADPRTRVTYVFPPKGNEITLKNPMVLLSDPKRRPFTKKAIDLKKPVLQGPFNLRQGGTGIVVRSPIFKEDNFLGLAIGVYDVDRLIKEAFKGISLDQMDIFLADANGSVFHGKNAIPPGVERVTIAVADSLWTLAIGWKIKVAGPPIMTRVRVWGLGGLFMTMVLWLIYLSQSRAIQLETIVKKRTKDLSEANEALQAEIRERKKTGKKLLNSHEMFLTVLDSIDATIYVADMKTHEIIFMNQHMVKAFGSDLTGQKCWEAFRGEKAPCSHCTNERLLDENGKPAGVCEWQDKNPITGKWYSNYDRAIRWIDQRYVRLQIATDITKLKEMETALRQSRKMEAIGTLAGGIAHDFNNILGIIMGNLELSLDDIPKDHRAWPQMKEIHTAALRAKEVVKQLLSFSRKTGVNQETLRINTLVNESIQLLRASIPSTIEIQPDISDSIPPITANPTQIQQVVINLCTNAAHAMEGNEGTLGVELKETSLPALHFKGYKKMEAGTYIQLTIRDTGHGIDTSTMEKIFDPYFTTKKIGKGTGMGLSIVHGIVTNHNGALSISSEPGKGTIVKIIFPVV